MIEVQGSIKEEMKLSFTHIIAWKEELFDACR